MSGNKKEKEVCIFKFEVRKNKKNNKHWLEKIKRCQKRETKRFFFFLREKTCFFMLFVLVFLGDQSSSSTMNLWSTIIILHSIDTQSIENLRSPPPPPPPL